jgi:hypothetical protein
MQIYPWLGLGLIAAAWVETETNYLLALAVFVTILGGRALIAHLREL